MLLLLSQIALSACHILAFILAMGGYGLLVRRWVLRSAAPHGLVDCFWPGVAGVLILCLWIHPWQALTPTVCQGILGLGLGVLVAQRPHFAWGLAARSWRTWIAVLLSVWIIARAHNPPSTYDTGLYYLATIDWINAAPVTEGLGNLHGRLAFNQSSFYLSALLNVLPEARLGHHFVNPACLIITCFLCAQHADFRAPRISDRLLACLASPLLALVLFEKSLEANPDTTALLLGIYLAYVAADFLPPATSETPWPRFALIALLTTTLPTIKLSQAAFALLLLLMALRELHRQRQLGIKALSLLTSLALLFLAPWMHKGWKESGWLLYPMPLLQTPAAHAIPQEQAALEYAMIQQWAWTDGAAGDDHHGREWLRYTIASRPDFFYYNALGFLALGLLILRRKALRPWLPWALIFIGSWVAWIHAAPAVRFLGIMAWLPMALALAMHAWSQREQRFLLIVSAAPLVGVTILLPHKLKTVNPHDGFTLPQAPARIVWVSPARTPVWIPLQGDQTWGLPLPCTHQVSPTLHIKKEREEFRFQSDSTMH